MAELVINKSNVPKGHLVEVPPYGAFENGKVYQVEELEERTVIGEDPNPPKTSPVKTDDTSAPDGAEEGK